MKMFLKTRAGVISVAAFVLLMAFAFHRVAGKRKARSAPPVAAAQATPAGPAPALAGASQPVAPAAAAEPASGGLELLKENAPYLDRYFELEQRQRADHDRNGNALVRRRNAGTPHDAGRTTENEPSRAAPDSLLIRESLRLHGRSPSARPGPAATTPVPQATAAPREGNISSPASDSSAGASAAPTVPGESTPLRFNPYGRVIKCELVFTIDSTNEQTPLIATVMEPVYNNGSLVIPAGAELHGTTRPDRLRHRIFSGTDWVLVFPREADRPNGRQLAVRGVALNRVEPDANGMTWGITDGSYGLEGVLIRTLQQEEIKRFVATFLASGSMAMQERQSDRSGQQLTRNTPQNAVLQGLGASFQKIVEDITKEIEQHGVFIRVPAGHQFYFYPMQIIEPEAALIPAAPPSRG